MLLEPGLYRLTGRASSGKTTFALDQARQHLAAGHRVLWLSTLRQTALREKLGMPTTPNLLWCVVDTTADALQIYRAVRAVSGVDLTVLDELPGSALMAVSTSAFSGAGGTVVLADCSDVDCGEELLIRTTGKYGALGCELLVTRVGHETAVRIAFVQPTRLFTVSREVKVERLLVVAAPSAVGVHAFMRKYDDTFPDAMWEESGTPDWGAYTVQECTSAATADVTVDREGERVLPPAPQRA